MIDSGEDEEIELLLGGVIPSADDDIDGFARHRNRGDLEAVYSREFVDSKFEAPTMRHLATREPKLCERGALVLPRTHEAEFESLRGKYPNILVTRSHWIT
jgi:U3 small nucleolar ribonucleoprotein component